MLHILLLILKIIGIVLLILLGILLVIALLVLFCPLYYHVRGEYSAEHKDLSIKVHWLSYIVSAKFRYAQDDISYYLKIFGYSFITSNDKIMKRRQVRFVKRQAKKAVKVAKEEVEESVDKVAQENKPQAQKQGLEEATPQKAVAPKIETETKNKKSSIFDIFRKIKASIKRFILRLKTLKNMKDDILDFLREEETKLAFASSKRYIFRLLRHIRPRKASGYLQFGFEDPAITGQVLGILAVAIPIYKGSVNVIPVFDHAVFEGVMAGAGHIRMIHFVRIIISIYRDKVLMMQIKKARNRFGGNKNGK